MHLLRENDVRNKKRGRIRNNPAVVPKVSVFFSKAAPPPPPTLQTDATRHGGLGKREDVSVSAAAAQVMVSVARDPPPVSNTGVAD